MDRDPKVDPADRQPSKAELGEDLSMDATPEALAWAVTRGGAKRWEKERTERLGEPRWVR